MTGEDRLIDNITGILVRFSGCPPDAVSDENRAAVAAMVRASLAAANGRLEMVLPAFPFKSINCRDKVFGPLPDAGEEVALQTLVSLCAALNEVVPARLMIVSDGHVFNDLEDVPDETVDAYFDALQDMNDSPHISFLRLKDFLGTGSAQDHRTALLRDFADNWQDIDRRIHNNEEDRVLYCGLKRFTLEDQAATRSPDESKGAYERRCGRLARHFFQRSQAYSKLIEMRMPHVFRLSIHPRPHWAPKMPIKLAPSADRWATPWHNVPVCNDKDSSVTLMHRRKAWQRNDCRLELRQGRPWRYVLI